MEWRVGSGEGGVAPDVTHASDSSTHPTPHSPLSRIVSLCPSLTELLFDLGVGDQVVGRTKFCIHPAAGVDSVEKVGGTKNPKLTRIIELAPDAVFMNEEENRVEDARALEQAGIRVHSSMPRTAQETAAMVRSIGAEVGAREAAERIARDIETRADSALMRARGRPEVSYAYLIWRDPLMTVNNDTFVTGLLSLSGGHNVFGQRAERYPTITPAELKSADPDLVLLSSEPFPFRDKHAAELVDASGLPATRFLCVDGELLSWHGSRTPRGIDYASQVLSARAGKADAAP